MNHIQFGQSNRLDTCVFFSLFALGVWPTCVSVYLTHALPCLYRCHPVLWAHTSPTLVRFVSSAFFIYSALAKHFSLSFWSPFSHSTWTLNHFESSHSINWRCRFFFAFSCFRSAVLHFQFGQPTNQLTNQPIDYTRFCVRSSRSNGRPVSTPIGAWQPRPRTWTCSGTLSWPFSFDLFALLQTSDSSRDRFSPYSYSSSSLSRFILNARCFSIGSWSTIWL